MILTKPVHVLGIHRVVSIVRPEAGLFGVFQEERRAEAGVRLKALPFQLRIQIVRGLGEAARGLFWGQVFSCLGVL